MQVSALETKTFDDTAVGDALSIHASSSNANDVQANCQQHIITLHLNTAYFFSSVIDKVFACRTSKYTSISPVTFAFMQVLNLLHGQYESINESNNALTLILNR